VDPVVFWYALNSVPGLGAVGMRRAVSVFGSPRGVLEAPPEELVARGRLQPFQAYALGKIAERLDALEAELASAQKDGVCLILLGEPGYPGNLAETSDAPPLLYVRGSLLPTDSNSVALVGTRRPDARGLQAARELAWALARAGICVVSGLAVGIDGAAHRGALEAGGRTIAVLGSGVLRPYPWQHQALASAVARQGALVSEVPLRARATTPTLMARNRLLAGLAKAVVVVQSRGTGGAPVTAKRAVALGRPAYYLSRQREPFKSGCRELEALGAAAFDWPCDVAALAAAAQG